MNVKKTEISCGIGQLFGFKNNSLLTKKRFEDLVSVGPEQPESNLGTYNFITNRPYKVLFACVTDSQTNAENAKKFLTEMGFRRFMRFQNPRSHIWNNVYKWVNTKYTLKNHPFPII